MTTSVALIDAPVESPAPTRTASTHPPRLKTIIGRLALSLLVACVIPAVLFYVTLVVINVWAALVAALAWTYSAIAWRWATKRRMSGLLFLTVGVMTIRTAVAVSSGDTFLYFLQPIITDAFVSSLFFISLASARPLVARLASDFYPMNRDIAQRPRIQRLFWRLTLMWALLCLGKAAMTLWLLQSQSLETFVLFKSVFILFLNALAVTATVCAAVMVARKEGLLTAQT